MDALKVGDPVRNIKTRTAGNIKEIIGTEASVEIFGEDGIVVYRVQDIELLNFEEYTLVKELVRLRAEKKEASELSKAADSAAAEAEDKIVEYLRKNSLESTKAYDGLGLAAFDGMKVLPSITEENRPAAFELIRAMGRADAIKENIHPATLAAIVSEMLDKGTEVPKCIGYFLKPKLSVRKK